MHKEERIIYYLINIESDQELNGRPYRIFEDMAVVYGILDQDRMMVHKIDHERAESCGWPEYFLWEKARQNTYRLLPARIEPVSKKIIGHTKDEPTFLASNDVRRYGAGVICYQYLLDDFAVKYDRNLYLILTSIHELIILFDDGRYQQEQLLEILRESNKELNTDQILSDNIYYYDRRKKELFGLF